MGLKDKEKIREFQKARALSKGEVRGSLKEKIGKDMDEIKDLGFNALGVIFKLELNQEDDYEIDLRQLLSISQKHLIRDAEELPLKMLQLGLLITKLKVKIKKLEIRRKSLYSVLFSKLRRDVENKKISDTALSRKVEENDKYKDLNKLIADYEFQTNSLDQVYWALKEKSSIVNKLIPIHNN